MANSNRYEDPEWGTFVGIDEASTLSCIPKSTLRLWRRPEYSHLIKFRWETIGNKVWYPLSDIQRYQRENGIDPEGKRSSVVFDEKLFGHLPPLERAKIVDPKLHDALTAARKITRLTWKKLRDKMFTDGLLDTVTYNNLIRATADELAAIWFKGEEIVPFVKGFPLNKNYPAFNGVDPEEHDRAMFMEVNTVRLIDAQINHRELSVADAAAIPLD